jgi:hypothetical protein
VKSPRVQRGAGLPVKTPILQRSVGGNGLYGRASHFHGHEKEQSWGPGFHQVPLAEGPSEPLITTLDAAIIEVRPAGKGRSLFANPN